MEIYQKKDPKILNKLYRGKMNDFSKIRRGSNFNAYTRKNLGSIPSKFDNFIFKLPEESKSNLSSVIHPMMAQNENLCFRKDIFKGDHKSWNNFGSGNSIELKGNTVKFRINNTLSEGKQSMSEYDSNNIDNFKNLYSNTSNSTNHTFYNNSRINKDSNNYTKDYTSSSDKNNMSYKTKNNSSIFISEIKNKTKSKSLTNIFSKEDRYDNIYYHRQFLSKYYPGPGEYPQKEFTDYFHEKFHFRYNSLFKTKSSIPLMDVRKTNYKVGPGSYLRATFKQNGIMGTFPKAKKILGESNKMKDDNYKDRDFNDLPSSITIHDKNKMSYFFLPMKKKKENLEKKYGIGLEQQKIENKKIKNDMNEYGEYNVKPRWGSKEKTKDFNNDWINRSLEKKILEEKKKGNIVDMYENFIEDDLTENNQVKQDTVFWARMAMEEIQKGKEEAKKKKGAYTFSTLPKLSRKENHVPGPSYYEPDKIMKAVKQKKEFNFNMEMSWI